MFSRTRYLNDTPNRLLFEIIVGSHAYGTNISTSDTDIRGIFIAPFHQRLSLNPPAAEISDKKQDIKYYELQKYFELAAECNPNIIEFLWTPPECIRYKDPVMDLILKNRQLFISKKAFHTFSGYAYAQIKKAKGQNKWINNPKPKDPPQREDFCWVIMVPNSERYDSADLKFNIDLWSVRAGDMPHRPVPLKDSGVDLSKYQVSALEHVSNSYRMYYYGDSSLGVFRNGNLVCESISKEDEWKRFSGILICNDHEYEKAMLEWKNYWTWVKERNQARWLDQENGKLDYDAKNMQHCVRLLMSGENILKYGEPIVRFEGSTLQFLRDIRAGIYSYDEIMKMVEERMVKLNELKDSSNLTWGVNWNQINSLYLKVIRRADFRSLIVFPFFDFINH